LKANQNQIFTRPRPKIASYSGPLEVRLRETAAQTRWISGERRPKADPRATSQLCG